MEGTNFYQRFLRIVREKENSIALHTAVFFTVGIILHGFAFTRHYALTLTPYILFFFTCLSILYSYLYGGKKLLMYLFIIFIFTFTLEAIGVATGKIFGEYRYGATLGLHLLNVPLIIGFNWVIVVLGMTSISQRFDVHPLIQAAFASSGAVIFDYILEPVAISLDYWKWQEGDIPVQNYIAWWSITFCCSLFYTFFVKKTAKPSRFIERYIIIQSLFFIGLRVVI